MFVPTQGSFLVWRHLFRERVGAGARCLDIGCGSGLQTIQLARNGAEHVHAIDLDPRAVGEHAHERVPQRRRRPRDRGHRGPLPVGARRALRRDRGEPLPDARRPVRGRREPSPARLLGAQPDRPPDRDAARCARAWRGRLPDAALDHRPGADRGAAGRARLRRPRASTSASSSSTSCSATRTSRSTGWRTAPTPTTSRWAGRRWSWPTCWRSHARPVRPGRELLPLGRCRIAAADLPSVAWSASPVPSPSRARATR